MVEKRTKGMPKRPFVKLEGQEVRDEKYVKPSYVEVRNMGRFSFSCPLSCRGKTFERFGNTT